MKYVKYGHGKWMPKPDPFLTKKALNHFYKSLGKVGIIALKAMRKMRMYGDGEL